MGDAKLLYGKWEDYDSRELPLLDACGGHFGATPDSALAEVYHYHVQDAPPFTVGCFGPAKVHAPPCGVPPTARLHEGRWIAPARDRRRSIFP